MASTQCAQLRFQRRDARIAFDKQMGDICKLKPLRNMLQAVGVPGVRIEQQHLFRPRVVAVKRGQVHFVGSER